MKHINLRLTEEEFLVVEQISKILNQSVPSLLKELSLKELTHIRKKIALDLFSQKKLDLKERGKFQVYHSMNFNKPLFPQASNQMYQKKWFMK